jgi:hypoxanthine-DNA glycosylase
MKSSDSEHLKTVLPPVIDGNTRFLVLGSLPSDEAIKKKQYYANPDNHFWSIVYAVFDGGSVHPEYAQRLGFLRSVGVGLWDVLHSANRDGNLDSQIRGEVPNDITKLLAEHPHIEKVLVNGTKARDMYKRYCKAARLDATYVPSSSPTPGLNVLPVEDRIKKWCEAVGSYTESV